MRFVKHILALLLVAGCGDGGVSPSVRDQLKSSVSSGATSFDFAAADPTFSWDRMHVFGPYSGQADVEKELGFRWSDYGRTTIGSSDGVVLLVFVRDGKVVYWYEHPRDAGDLAPLDNDQGYTRTEAKFAIERRTDENWIELKPLPSTTNPADAG